MKTWRPEVILWDLDGTLAYWRSLWVVVEAARAYLEQSPGTVSRLAAGLAGARAFRRILEHQGLVRNDALFVKMVAASLKMPASEVQTQTERFLASNRLRDIVARYICPIPEALALFRSLSLEDERRHVVATNPVMPVAFNRLRLGLAGYPVQRFWYICGSEDFSGQKHHPSFYPDLLVRIGARAEEALMIGNDPKKDLAVGGTGIRTFLLRTPFSVPRSDWPSQPDWEGNYAELGKHLREGWPLTK